MFATTPGLLFPLMKKIAFLSPTLSLSLSVSPSILSLTHVSTTTMSPHLHSLVQCCFPLVYVFYFLPVFSPRRQNQTAFKPKL